MEKKELMYFYLKSCPYCHEAERWVEELQRENPAYRTVTMEWIEEREQARLADQYDYYYVPTYYLNGRKLHEGAATKAKIEEVLKAALQSRSKVG